MPNLDRTGPRGQGPMTGWKTGLCRDKDAGKEDKDTNENVVYGLGRGGRPYGGGRGWGWGGGRRRGFRGGFGRNRGGWGYGRNRIDE
ncbi:MAG: DUF5320 domain-containing protein [Ignavibacteria bacterium]|nr:DUF5320 domain-containing protein [Ignavibacteria bacterium]